MRLEPPPWWYRGEAGALAYALTPVAAAVDAFGTWRWNRIKPYRSRLPVICVGNLTAGGAGKTPLAICIAAMLTAAGRKPGFLTRGFGGSHRGPHTVDISRDTAIDVGDEALLLARHALVIVARDRAAGAKALEVAGADVIVMDDGLQNPQLAKQLTIAVLDPQRLIGNGRVMPAGPLRQDLATQLRRTDALVVLCGAGEAMPPLTAKLQAFPGPVLCASLLPQGQAANALKGIRVVAYAGIGRPSKLFDTLRAIGAHVAEEVPFPDHHRFSAKDADRLLNLALEHGGTLVTTEKDLARQSGDGELRALQQSSIGLSVVCQFKDRDLERFRALLSLLLNRHPN